MNKTAARPRLCGATAATPDAADELTTTNWIDLYWLPVGAGGHFVRWNGRMYERMCAWREHRRPRPLFHSALVIRHGGTTYAVEMGPVWNVPGADHGAVCQGPVGAHALGRLKAFQYEVRCWPNGTIPDLAEAIDCPVRVSDRPEDVAAVLRVLRTVPPLTWGRDELGAGEMWNSNSVVSWALDRAGLDARALQPPHHGRAPGWDAGLVLAERQRRGHARRERERGIAHTWLRDSGISALGRGRRIRP